MDKICIWNYNLISLHIIDPKSFDIPEFDKVAVQYTFN